jgi:phosphatidylglycerol:prolipoprotein diacylglycerol transferase
MTLFGILFSGAYVYVSCKKLGYNEVNGLILVSLGFVGVIIGGPILYALVNLGNAIGEIRNIPPIGTFRTIIISLQIIFSGNIFYGGLLGGLIAILIVIRIKPHFKPLIDVVVPGIPLFHFWGRIGCFMSGCCYGVESPVGFTMRLSEVPGANDISRFPVQLLESLFNISLFIVLHYIRKKNIFQNKMVFVYLLCYSVGRFCLEFLRGDVHRGFFLTMSTSQNISILLFVFSILMLKFYSPKVNALNNENE